MKINWKQAAGRVWKDLWKYKALGLVLGVYYLFMEKVFSAFCPLVIVTGLPCPGCGMTRAALCVLSGQFTRAWDNHPLIYGVILAVFYAGVKRYLLNREVREWKAIIGILAVLMIVVYFYRMYCYFPDRPPLSITGDSLFERFLPGYGEFLRRMVNQSRMTGVFGVK